MKKLNALLLATALGLSVILTACGGSASSAANEPAADNTASEVAAETNDEADEDNNTPAEDVVIKVGATAAPHGEILEQVAPILAEQGITLELTIFQDYVMPNTALEDGSLDANYFQHLPYLDNFNEEWETSLVSIGGIHIEPMGVYPGKSDDLDNIADGAQVGIPNDVTNRGRALLLLENLGLITLDENAGVEADILDIVENPHNIDFVQLAAEQLPISLEDLDFGVINGNYAIANEINDLVLVNEDANSPYVNIVAVRAGDESRPELVALVNALQSDEIRDFINEKYAGEVLPVF